VRVQALEGILNGGDFWGRVIARVWELKVAPMTGGRRELAILSPVNIEFLLKKIGALGRAPRWIRLNPDTRSGSK
jgi:hypothetical protein